MSIERSSVYADPTLVTDPARVRRQARAGRRRRPQDAADERLADRRAAVRLHRPYGRATQSWPQVKDARLPGVGFVPGAAAAATRRARVASTDHRSCRRRGPRARRPRVPLRRAAAGHSPARSSSSATSEGRDIPDTERRTYRGAPRYRSRAHDRRSAAVSGRVDPRRPGDRDRGQGRHGRRRRRRRPATWSRWRPIEGADDGRASAPARGRGRRQEQAAHRPLRAGLDEQADHDRDRDRERQRRAATRRSRCRRASVSAHDKSYTDGARRPGDCAMIDDRHPPRVVERRHDHDREAVGRKGRARRVASQLRARDADVDRLPGPARRAAARARRVLRRPAWPRVRSATASRSPRMQMVDVYATIAQRRRDASRRVCSTRRSTRTASAQPVERVGGRARRVGRDRGDDDATC